MAEAPKKPKKRLSEAARKRRIESSRARDRTRINVGPAFTRWRELRDRTGCKTDADLAVLVLDYYSTSALSNNESARPRPLEALYNCELDRFPLSSSESDAERGDRRSFVRLSDNGMSQNITERVTEWASSNQSETREISEAREEEFTSSLSVGDGCYMVDLGNPSEFVVDEECILQLLQSCRECSRPCAVTKRVEGLKVTVRQTCRHCDSCYEWTNL